jgi:hypothetical protein
MITAILTGILLTLALPADEASLRERFQRSMVGEEAHRARQEAAAALDGRILVVRRYADWPNAPGEFAPLRVRFKGNQVTLEPDEATIPPVVVITSEDQEDEAVGKAVGDHICVQTATKKLELRLPFPHGHDAERQLWQFTDALGEPLGGAAVEIWLADYRGPRIRFGRTTLDDTGRLAWKTLLGNLRTVSFVVSHPDYGCAEAGEIFESDRKLVLPLVRRGTLAAERAIRGRVVDPNGVPVAGAAIECPNVRTLGEGLINGLGRACKGITDANGLFSFYLPNRKRQDDRGELIPPKSQYYVRIEAPRKLGLLPYVEPIENGWEALVVLERGDRLRRLRFEDQHGRITDPARLETITVCLRRPGRNILMLHYDDWKDGAPLIPGTYEASTYERGGESRFEPVELTRESSEEVIFRLPAAVTYYGRVVHGVTGRPMAGAFVLTMSSARTGMQLHELTAEQWDALHGLASDPPADDAALDPLRKVYAFTKLVRTDAAGSYSVTPEPDQGFYGFILFERDYLAVMYRKHSLQAGPDHCAEVPTIKLFPAATVFVEPAVDSDYLPVMPRWAIDEGTRPAWVEELLSMDSGRESALEYSRWLKLNISQRVPVPAGVSLRLKLETPYNEEFCPILIPQVIYLGQGETADLGRFTFEPALAVQVKAVDAAGQALEGIPIRKLCVGSDGKRAWSVPHNTDEQGLARFHVVPNSTGSFGVFCGSRESGPLNATVDYEVGGPEDAGREFVLRLSDEMLAQLLQ